MLPSIQKYARKLFYISHFVIKSVVCNIYVIRNNKIYKITPKNIFELERKFYRINFNEIIDSSIE